MHNIVTFAEDTLGVKLYPGQAAVLSNYYESGRQNWLLLSGRRGGKSLLSDVIVAYESVIPDLSAYTRPGEDRYILLVSVREDSAKIHIRQVAKLLKHTRAIGKMITQVKEDRIMLNNGVVILSLPASARAARGYTASALVMDEAAFFVDTLGNSSAEAIFTALAPTVATFGDQARITITTSVNTKAGIVYELYDRATQGELDDWHVTKCATRELNPKVGQKVIDNALRRDPESAQAEYFAEFREQTEAFLSSEAIERCVDRGLKRSEKGRGESYLMACDPALMKDRYGFGIAHLASGVVILDYINRLLPPVDANGAEDLLKSLAERFKPTGILCDNASTVQRLKGELKMVYTPFSRQQKLRIYGALKEAVNLGLLALPPDDDLLDELKALQIRGGVDISAPKAGRITHDDMADCLALLVDGLQSGQYRAAGMIVVPDPFSEANEAREAEGERAVQISTGTYIWARWFSPHPAGVNADNCRHSDEGCRACILERDAAGYYAQQEEAERQFEGYTSAAQERAQERAYWQQQAYQQAEAKYKIIDLFKKL